MPCRYVIDKEHRMVLTTAWDVVTTAEALDHQNQLRADVNFDPSFAQLIDGTQVTKLEISPEDVEMLAARNVFSPHSRRAFVATEAAVFGVLRMFQVYRESSGAAEEIQVFYDMDSAQRWLSAGMKASAQGAHLS